MAIAYFIPDQAKLLAASSAHSSHNNSSAGGGGGGGGVSSNSTSASPTAQTHTQAAHGPGGGDQTHNTAHHSVNNNNNNFRANITIPLSAYSASTTAHSDVGCWDLLTQIFCHALRFCHQCEHHPAIIQISLEISSSGPTGATTVQVDAQAAPVQQQQQQEQQQTHEPSVSPMLFVHPTMVPSNAAPQHQNLVARDAQRPTAERSSGSVETPTAAADASNRNLEPGTHKPPAKRN
ncbi:cell death protein Grim [Anastrepha obliqua]|uniref:cell death protein Grim n=1 Tax=Anastrepha obliqua TaxID=95512 RepID=UPI002409CDFD|nr:cell death protein Grim [Anastrepha obliqua]